MGRREARGRARVFLGEEVAVAVFVALVAGVGVGLVIIARKGARAGRKTVLAFGRSSPSRVVAVVAGQGLLDAYLAGV